MGNPRHTHTYFEQTCLYLYQKKHDKRSLLILKSVLEQQEIFFAWKLVWIHQNSPIFPQDQMYFLYALVTHQMFLNGCLNSPTQLYNACTDCFTPMANSLDNQSERAYGRPTCCSICVLGYFLIISCVRSDVICKNRGSIQIRINSNHLKTKSNIYEQDLRFMQV